MDIVDYPDHVRIYGGSEILLVAWEVVQRLELTATYHHSYIRINNIGIREAHNIISLSYKFKLDQPDQILSGDYYDNGID